MYEFKGDFNEKTHHCFVAIEERYYEEEGLYVAFFRKKTSRFSSKSDFNFLVSCCDISSARAIS